MTENRQPCFYNDDGEPVVYRREDPPPGDGPRFLFPEFEPCVPGDRESSYKFVVSMAKCLGGATKPMNVDSLASRYATTYVEGHVPPGLNGPKLIAPTTWQEWLLTMIGLASINPACHMALQKILIHHRDTRCAIPPELLDWDPNALPEGYKRRMRPSSVTMRDRRSVAEYLIAMCGVLHAVVHRDLPTLTGDRILPHLSLCDAVSEAMGGLGYTDKGQNKALKSDTLRKIVVNELGPGGLPALREQFKANVLQPDRSDNFNSAVILRCFGFGKKLS